VPTSALLVELVLEVVAGAMNTTAASTTSTARAEMIM
jgi:hypothetical protein